jgi:TatA/E family protein of Tat protein translocase
MDPFSFGRVEELLLILVVMLVLFGPDRLPEMAGQLARFIRTFQRYTSRITSEFTETMQELEREYTATKGDWKSVGQGLSDAATSVQKDLHGAITDAATVAKDGGPSVDGQQTGPSRRTRSSVEFGGRRCFELMEPPSASQGNHWRRRREYSDGRTGSDSSPGGNFSPQVAPDRIPNRCRHHRIARCFVSRHRTHQRERILDLNSPCSGISSNNGNHRRFEQW